MNGIHKSASAMLLRIKKQEVTANNLANASTPGYKKDKVFSKELSQAEKKILGNQQNWVEPMTNQVYTNFTPGSFDKTGNDTDLAIDGDGFFTLQLQDGSRALTRNGAFRVNQDGLLEIPGGALVVGDGGPIEVGSGKVEVSANGIVQSNGATVGTITPVTVADYDQLEKVGGALFVVPDEVELIPVQHSTIQQGYLEASNVDIVREMIEMIISYRNYEADSKSIQTQDRRLDHLFNRVASEG